MKGRDAIRELVERVRSSPDSNFYRNKYQGDTVVDAFAAGGDVWNDFPFLTREDIEAVPLSERLFISPRALKAVRVTSGTSGTAILCVPRMGNEERSTSRWHHVFIRDLPVRRVATFSGAQFLYADRLHEKGSIGSLQLIPGNMKLSAKLIEKYRPDILAGFPYVITALAALLGKSLYPVRAIQLFGERCTALQWDYLLRCFPDVPIFVEYASIEAQMSLAESCWSVVHARKPYVHPIGEYAYIELVDVDTQQVVEGVGARGEIVVTTLRSVAFPLIRYRTGDVARIVQSRCGCGNTTPVLSIEGRIDIDRIRMYGGEIQTEELDRALATFSNAFLDTEYQAIFGEREHDGRIMPCLTVVCWHDEKCVSTEMLSERLAQTLRVGPQKTYAQGVASGEYLPLRVIRRQLSAAAGKRKRLVREESLHSLEYV